MTYRKDLRPGTLLVYYSSASIVSCEGRDARPSASISIPAQVVRLYRPSRKLGGAELAGQRILSSIRQNKLAMAVRTAIQYM